jgi:hypothetical protein
MKALLCTGLPSHSPDSFPTLKKPVPVAGYIRTIERSLVSCCMALLLACNYFAFQIEIFEEEYEANQPMRTETENAISSPTITWESFAKDRAQKAFIITINRPVEAVLVPHPEYLIPFYDEPTPGLVRDKSPPARA